MQASKLPSLVPKTLNPTCHTNNLAAKSYLAFGTDPKV
jgi:hypothetical protein